VNGMEAYLEELDTLDSRRFLIAVRKLANSLTYGTDKSSFLGAGIEYVQSRLYQQGDSVRAIDWRVTARTGRFHVKEYEPERSMPCYLMIDTSASMAVSSRLPSKYQTALYIAGGIALASLDRVSPVGVIGAGGRALRVEPSLSKNKILEWITKLRRYRFDEPTELGKRLREIGPQLRHRVLIVVLSDLHDPDALPALKRLAQLHDCVVLKLMDPAEEGLRGSGFFRAIEAETGREFVTHGRRRQTDHRLIAAELKRSGIDHLVIRTDRPFAPALRDLFRARGWVGRGAR
jgi:uncharacterized protein (DUF58 family)